MSRALKPLCKAEAVGGRGGGSAVGAWSKEESSDRARMPGSTPGFDTD